MSTRWFLLLVAALSVAGLARLGVWQLDRAAQKTRLQAAITAQQSQPLLTALEPEARQDEAAIGRLLHRPVRLRGHWQPQATLYLDNRPMAGRVGFIVLTPLQLEGRNEAIVVQRGWIPRDAQDRTRLVPIQTPDGLVEVEGRLAPEPSRLFDFKPTTADGDNHAEAGVIRQNVDLEALGLATGLRLYQRLTVLQQGGTAAGGSDGLLREWPSPVANVQRHYGYAFQWFAMSAVVLGLALWFQIIRPLRERHHV